MFLCGLAPPSDQDKAKAEGTADTALPNVFVVDRPSSASPTKQRASRDKEKEKGKSKAKQKSSSSAGVFPRSKSAVAVNASPLKRNSAVGGSMRKATAARRRASEDADKEKQKRESLVLEMEASRAENARVRSLPGKTLDARALKDLVRMRREEEQQAKTVAKVRAKAKATASASASPVAGLTVTPLLLHLLQLVRKGWNGILKGEIPKFGIESSLSPVSPRSRKIPT